MAKILDQYGNPIDTGALKEPQTARIAALSYELVQSQLEGLTPAGAARILRDADQGDIVAQHRLFDDMYDRDAHLRCEMDKRTSAPLTLDWDIAPPANATPAEKAAADWVKETLRDVVDDLEDVLLAMMDGVGHGFSPIELEWQRDGNVWLPTFHPRPQTWFKTDMARRELLLANGGLGEAPIPMGWILHIHRKVKTGYLGRAGLLRAVVWSFLYKAYSIGDFAEFLEIYGLPMIVGKYMPGAGPEEKASLLRAVAALGRDARAIMPDGMAIEVQKVVSGGGTGNPHLDMVDWADRAQSKAILGQVLSSEAKATGMGSGVADLHGEVRRDIRNSDAKQIAATLTRDLVYPLIAFNRPGVDGLHRCPRFVFDLGEGEDLKLYAEALPALAAGGLRIPVEWVHDKLRIPQAADGDPTFSAPPSPAGGGAGGEGATPAAPKAANLAALAAEAQDTDAQDIQAARLTAAAAPLMADKLAQIEAMIEAADSLEALRANLLAAYPDLSRGEMAKLLAQAFQAEALAGVADVQGETGGDA